MANEERQRKSALYVRFGKENIAAEIRRSLPGQWHLKHMTPSKLSVSHLASASVIFVSGGVHEFVNPLEELLETVGHSDVIGPIIGVVPTTEGTREIEVSARFVMTVITLDRLNEVGVRGLLSPRPRPMRHANEASATQAAQSIMSLANPPDDSAFIVSFDARLSAKQINGTLTALANYFRGCGGVGLTIEDSQLQEAGVRENVHV